MNVSPPLPDNSQQNPEAGSDSPCFLLLAYEDEASREHAQHVVDHLVEALWTDVPFEFLWWDLRELDDPDNFHRCNQDAVRADIVLISLHSSGAVDDRVISWVESWIGAKQESTTLLVALIGLEADERKGYTPMHVQLRNLATRAHIDFLPLVLHSLVDHETNDNERLVHRANDTSPVLDSILNNVPDRSEARWGFYE